ncbi:subunit of U2 snRNP spliceosome [Hamiltosporidium magnivora]|uniref:Subunit of U2 snRNP spliceosome n=1 Tax=Hamiltosporidium magnivora TaxID=148818 RepID=A0A4Q9LDR6_9MICR|nr:subunit of U2 snRNP spliceosome [Hamiltosporidium magnivora]
MKNGKSEFLIKVKKKDTKSEWEDEVEEVGVVEKISQTPRTTTQTKRMMWDQTPVGRIKNGNFDTICSYGLSSKWDLKPNSDKFFIKENVEFNLKEIIKIVPRDIFKVLEPPLWYLDNKKEENFITDLELPCYKAEDYQLFNQLILNIGSESFEIEILKNLICLKNGEKKEVKNAKKKLLKIYGKNKFLYEKITSILISSLLNDIEKLKYLEFLKILIEYSDECFFLKDFMIIMATFILGKYFRLHKICIEIFYLIFTKHDHNFVLLLFEDEIKCKNEIYTKNISFIIYLMINFYDLKSLTLFFKSLNKSKYNKANELLAEIFVQYTLKHRNIDFKFLVKVILKLLKKENEFLKVKGCEILNLAIYKSTDSDIFLDIIDYIYRECHNVSTKVFVNYLNVLATFREKFEIENFKIEIFFRINKLIYKRFYFEKCLEIYRKICLIIEKEDSFYFLQKHFKLILTTKKIKNLQLLLEKVLKNPKNINIVFEMYRNESEVLRNLISKVIVKIDDLYIGDVQMNDYFDCLNFSLSKNDIFTIKNLEILIKKSNYQYVWIKKFFEIFISEFIQRDYQIKIYGTQKVSKIIAFLEKDDILLLYSLLIENLKDENSEIFLESILNCLLKICQRKIQNTKELVLNLTILIKNRNKNVQENILKILKFLCKEESNECENIHSKEWLRIVYGIIDILDSPSKNIRVLASECIGYISINIGPQDILNILMNSLKTLDRNQRNTTCLAISILADYCGLFTVLPTLLTDYSIPESIIQHGILKSISMIFGRVNIKGRDYIPCLINIIEDSLSEKDIVHRQLGMICVKSIVLSCKSPNINQDLLIHLFNYVFPNIFETSVYLEDIFFQCMEVFCLKMDPLILIQYLVQGLFHPAKRVRNKYFKILEMVEKYRPDSFITAFSYDEDAFLNYEIF